MSLQQLEEVFRKTQEKLKKLQHYNNFFCTDYLPPNTTHTHNDYLDGQIGRMIVTSKGEKLFVPMSIYEKLLLPVAETNLNEEEAKKYANWLYVTTPTGTVFRLNSQEMIALGTIAHFLDE